MSSAEAPLGAGAPSAAGFPGGALLGNGAYRVLLDADGHGVSECEDRERGTTRLTAWTADPVEDAGGFFLHLRAPGGPGLRLGGRGGTPTARFQSQGGVATWSGGALGVDCRIEVAVAPDRPLEARRVTLTNSTNTPRRLDLTSYAEVVLHDPAAHASHPAFSRLFIQTEQVAGHALLLARRRPRTPEERFPWLFHALVGAPLLEFETDRGRFLGRGGTCRHPAALEPGARLSGSAGNVLDPIVSLRTELELPPGASCRVTFLLGCAGDREGALALAAGIADPDAVDRMFAAAVRADAERRTRAGLSEVDAARAEALAVAILTGAPTLRAPAEVLARATGPLNRLAPFGLSSRRPFLLVDERHSAGSAAPAPWPEVHAGWRALGAPIDLVCLGSQHAPPAAGAPIRLSPESLDAGTLDLLAAAAHAVAGSGWPEWPPGPGGAAAPSVHAEADPAPSSPWRASDALEHFNGCGGFAHGGREYVVRVRLSPAAAGRQLPPRPWTNVLANDTVGCLVSETGAGYTWSRNSREHRLTPWSNDQVLDAPGEAFYLRDDDSGRYISLFAGPVVDGADVEMVHGLGYSRCRRHHAGIDCETSLFVPPSDPLRVTRVVLTNRRDHPARLTLYGWYRLVLGDAPETAGRFVVTRHDAASGTLLADSAFRGDYAGGTAFAAVTGPYDTLAVSADRAAFLGPGGSPACPEALRTGAPLDGRTGAGLDPAFAQQVRLTLAPGASTEIAFLFGEAADDDAVAGLVAAWRAEGAVGRAEAETIDAWRARADALLVRTPVPELDVMLNGWLPYQTLACRIQARSAHYQSGGAYGFRDQLQDAMAFVYLEPEVARRQILRHAAHQFVEGDVLHWWHTPRSRGLRTRFADDLLWLPWLTAFYVGATGDRALLDEPARFLTAPLLAPGEDESFLLPEDSGTSASVYEHCLRAIDRSLGVGAHGLPLFGVGDWNDGMSRVGREGRGESVWMAFFLMTILAEFAPLCAARGDTARVERYARHREALRVAVNTAGWDGSWYRRGYYDNGAPLGSRSSDECRIDALAQAWAVLSGAADESRREQALDELEARLVSESDGIIRLLTPPFVDTPNDPGYIKGYVAGVRENGGQYTHAALWVVRAMAEAGRNNRAAPLLAMLSPLHHTRTPEAVSLYQVEPYVIAADVYGAAPHVGRGGWTWYTGSAAWMYRVGIESILGLTWHEGTTIHLAPCVPDDWPEFRITWRLPRPHGAAAGPETVVDIVATNPRHHGRGVAEARFDGALQAVTDGVARIRLPRDGGRHRIDIVLGHPAA